uniref:Uncharacterized protein n=1 Tax=Rhodococcus sp. NS1 TaxID=402236 RepID=A0A097SQB4_9NOCA|nr:hypothetical protein LRS1606.276 [Rhodococcus sp. NS1]
MFSAAAALSPIRFAVPRPLWNDSRSSGLPPRAGTPRMGCLLGSRRPRGRSIRFDSGRRRRLEQSRWSRRPGRPRATPDSATIRRTACRGELIFTS